MAAVDGIHIVLEILSFFRHLFNVLTGRKFRLYPTAKQAQVFSQWIGCQRVIRNAKVEETRLNAWLRRASMFSDRPGNGDAAKAFDQAYSHFATEQNPWLREVPSQILRNGIYRAKTAFVRFWKGEAKPPVFHGKQSEESVLLTGELFSIKDGKLLVGTHRTPLGEVRWKAHRAFQAPKMLTITRCGDGAWFASFSCEDGTTPPSSEELLVQHAFAPEASVLAFDRGVAHPLADSEGNFHDLEPKRRKRLETIQRRKEALQSKLARQKKGSAARRKTKKRLARAERKRRNQLSDWRHQTTARIAGGSHSVLVLEALRLASMTKAVEPKPNPAASAPGQPSFLPNGASAKSGLNRALLQVGLGEIRSLLEYKARRTGKAVLLVSPQFSSQECSKCAHTSPDNRPTQAEFHCRACGFEAHADYNAAVVLRRRGHALLQSHRPMGTKGRKTPARKRPAPLSNRKPPPQRSGAGGR